MSSTILEVSGLHKGYRLGSREIKVLEDLDLQIESGELLVIMGPSGSGKTTLLNCVSGIDTPDAGTVRLQQQTVDYSSETALNQLRRQQIGMVFQFFNLIPSLNVAENVGLPSMISGNQSLQDPERVRQLLELVGMQKREHHLPSQLSGGEMQLVSIARALLHKPALLLADEPTGNVNPQVGRTIMDILRSSAKQENAAVLMVTHSPEHATWADRICFLKEGRIAAELQQDGEDRNPAPIHAKLLELNI